MTALAVAGVVGLAVLVLAVVLAVREWRLDRALDRVVAGTEARYEQLVANGEQLAGADRCSAPNRLDDVGSTDIVRADVGSTDTWSERTRSARADSTSSADDRSQTPLSPTAVVAALPRDRALVDLGSIRQTDGTLGVSSPDVYGGAR